MKTLFELAAQDENVLHLHVARRRWRDPPSLQCKKTAYALALVSKKAHENVTPVLVGPLFEKLSGSRFKYVYTDAIVAVVSTSIGLATFT